MLILGSTHSMFVCCRDGKYRSNNEQRKTEATRNSKPSRKLESSFCLARMTVTTTESGRVHVQYVRTHTNHDSEMRFLPLPPSVRNEVQLKFARGISIERIMDGEF